MGKDNLNAGFFSFLGGKINGKKNQNTGATNYQHDLKQGFHSIEPPYPDGHHEA
jgi:hypothetical protein